MKKITILTILFFFLFSMCSYAHSGRTDSQGGHHDYQNVSGLGDYHFHEGHEAHLHIDGVCPYADEDAAQDDSTRNSSSGSDNNGFIVDEAPVVEIHEWWAFWELQTLPQLLSSLIVLFGGGYLIIYIILLLIPKKRKSN